MDHAGLIAYFLVSYSIGLASLVISLASYLKRRSPPARDFLLVSVVFAVIGATSMSMNLFNVDAIGGLTATLLLVNHAGATVFIVLLPLLVHSVYKTPRSRSLNLGFLALACLTAVVAVALATVGLADAGGRLVLGIKDLAILYVIVRLFSYRRRRHDGEMENVLHFTMIATAVIYPFILVSELAPAAFRVIVPLESRGSLTLPLVYSLWSVAYLLSWFRGYVRPLAVTDGSYQGFSARFGLSPREGEVLRLLLEGQSYKEIMASLAISMPTVKTHIGSLYRKTGCNNKMQLSLLFSSAVHPKV